MDVPVFLQRHGAPLPDWLQGGSSEGVLSELGPVLAIGSAGLASFFSSCGGVLLSGR